jgi:hypothetical protein
MEKVSFKLGLNLSFVELNRFLQGQTSRRFKSSKEVKNQGLIHRKELLKSF